MKLQSQRIGVPDLSCQDRADMFALFAGHYDCADRDRFEADLARKHWVIQLRDPAQGRLCGFSTQVLLKIRKGNSAVNALFSGDTIVDPACWSETALMREWGRLVVELIEATRPERLYWFLISKGYKTYRFLPVFFREFYPRYDRTTPASAQEILDSLGRSMFGRAYDARRGVVTAMPDKDRLRMGIAEITAHRLEDPHVRYFLERNPGHTRGDELCCLARLDVANFTPAAVRLLDPENRPQQQNRPPELSGVP